jgi:hypothetical protein
LFDQRGREIYLFLPYGVHQSKLANGLTKTGDPFIVTSRNWLTVCAVASMTTSY